MKKRILIPLPTYGFDPTEASIPWQLLSSRFEICFATPKGQKAKADALMITGEQLGLWKKFLMAREDAIDAYQNMKLSDAFSNPLKYADIRSQDFHGLLLPGGHDKGMREYLESSILQQCVIDFFSGKKPVAAICHGVVLVARSLDHLTKKSVIHDYKATALLKSQELGAYNLTCLWLKDYYLTYPGKTVEAEVISNLSDKKNFIKGPIPYARDDMKHLNRGFTVRDRNFLSARWPGDVYRFSIEFEKMLA